MEIILSQNDYFPQIVGLNKVKRKLSFYLNSYRKTGIMKHLLLCGGKGVGKSYLAAAIARNLKISNSNIQRPAHEINAASILNPVQFFIHIVEKRIKDNEVTIFIDEIGNLKDKITCLLLSALNPNKENRNLVEFEDFIFECDFRKVTFIFATTDPQKVNPSFLDRVERLDLPNYSKADLSEIIRRNLPHIKFKNNILDKISDTLRSNARAAQKRATEINDYTIINNKLEFGEKEWKELQRELNIYPLGLSEIEIEILRFLSDRGETSLTQLSAKTGVVKEALQKDFELHLLKKNLIDIRPRGRILTTRGRKLLEVL